MPSPYQANHDSYLHNYRNTGIRKIIGLGREVAALSKAGQQFEAFLSIGEHLGGFMVEASGSNDIRECDHSLTGPLPPISCYKTLCDPRLNYQQSLDYTTFIADEICKGRSSNAALILVEGSSKG